FAGEDFEPGDLSLPAVGFLDGGVEDEARGFPDVASGAVAFDEGNDRPIRDAEGSARVVDGRAVRRHRHAVVRAFHGYCSVLQMRLRVFAYSARRSALPNRSR